MNNLNSVILEGNITRQPELRETPNGFKVCTIPIATNHYYKSADGDDIQEVSYIDISVFGDKRTEYCMGKSQTGRGIRVTGRIKQDRWKDETGQTKSRIFVVAEHVEFRPLFNKTQASSDTAALAEQVLSEETTAEEASPSDSLSEEETVF